MTFLSFLFEYIRCFIEYVFLNLKINAKIKHSFFRTNKRYLFNTFWISSSEKNTLEKPFTERQSNAKITHISVPKNQCVYYNISSFCPPPLEPPIFCLRALLGRAGFIGFNFIALNYSENINI